MKTRLYNAGTVPVRCGYAAGTLPVRCRYAAAGWRGMDPLRASGCVYWLLAAIYLLVALGSALASGHAGEDYCSSGPNVGDWSFAKMTKRWDSCICSPSIVSTRIDLRLT